MRHGNVKVSTIGARFVQRVKDAVLANAANIFSGLIGGGEWLGPPRISTPPSGGVFNGT
jgi:hypothetical protein